ncbi:hypothetical protein SDJN02_04904, partial [Cucurbita argyrosperma subsp. argyrosperma]
MNDLTEGRAHRLVINLTFLESDFEMCVGARGFVFSSIPKLCRLVMVILVLPELTVALWTKPCKAHCSEPPTWTCSAPSIFWNQHPSPISHVHVFQALAALKRTVVCMWLQLKSDQSRLL